MSSPVLIKSSHLPSIISGPCRSKVVNGKTIWIPVRPESPWGFNTIKQRIKLAYLVFIGRYDAFDWEN